MTTLSDLFRDCGCNAEEKLALISHLTLLRHVELLRQFGLVSGRCS